MCPIPPASRPNGSFARQRCRSTRAPVAVSRPLIGYLPALQQEVNAVDTMSFHEDDGTTHVIQQPCLAARLRSPHLHRRAVEVHVAEAEPHNQLHVASWIVRAGLVFTEVLHQLRQQEVRSTSTSHSFCIRPNGPRPRQQR